LAEAASVGSGRRGPSGVSKEGVTKMIIKEGICLAVGHGAKIDTSADVGG
jgi:hypothetical protein